MNARTKKKVTDKTISKAVNTMIIQEKEKKAKKQKELETLRNKKRAENVEGGAAKNGKRKGKQRKGSGTTSRTRQRWISDIIELMELLSETFSVNCLFWASVPGGNDVLHAEGEQTKQLLETKAGKMVTKVLTGTLKCIKEKDNLTRSVEDDSDSEDVQEEQQLQQNKKRRVGNDDEEGIVADEEENSVHIFEQQAQEIVSQVEQKEKRIKKIPRETKTKMNTAKGQKSRAKKKAERKEQHAAEVIQHDIRLENEENQDENRDGHEAVEHANEVLQQHTGKEIEGEGENIGSQEVECASKVLEEDSRSVNEENQDENRDGQETVAHANEVLQEHTGKEIEGEGGNIGSLEEVEHDNEVIQENMAENQEHGENKDSRVIDEDGRKEDGGNQVDNRNSQELRKDANEFIEEETRKEIGEEKAKRRNGNKENITCCLVNCKTPTGQFFLRCTKCSSYAHGRCAGYQNRKEAAPVEKTFKCPNCRI